MGQTPRGTSISVGQVLVTQVFALVVVLAWPGGWVWRGPALALLVVMGCVAWGRYRGRWIFAWIALWVWYRRRRSTGPTTDHTEALEDVAVFVDRSGTRYGLVHDAGSWVTVLAIEPREPVLVAVGGSRSGSVPPFPSPTPSASAGPVGAPRDVLPIAAVTSALTDRDVRLADVRVVVRTMPAPSPLVDPRGAVATSYREVGAGAPIAQRSVWVTLRLDPALCPGAVVARGGGTVGSHRALAAEAARLASGLDRWATVRALGPDEVRASALVGFGAAPEPLAEDWNELAGASTRHVGYRLRSWGNTTASSMLESLSLVPSLTSMLSLTMSRGRFDTPPAADAEGGVPRRPVVRAALRTVVLPEDGPATEAAVHKIAGAHGAALMRADGEHAVLLRDSVPIGRGPGVAPGSNVISTPLPLDQLAITGISLDRGGVVIGRTMEGSPALLRLGAERPTSVTTTLDLGLVMVLAYRALATGCRVRVLSTRSERWLPLRRLGVDDPAVVAIGSPETPRGEVMAGRPDRPTLVVVDTGIQASSSVHAAQPWECVMTVLPDLSMRTLPGMRSSDAVLAGRLGSNESIAAGPFLGLSPSQTAELVDLSDEQVGVIERGRTLKLDLALTAAESHLLVAATSAQTNLQASVRPDVSV
jgi:type VII secretion protein EccE